MSDRSRRARVSRIARWTSALAVALRGAFALASPSTGEAASSGETISPNDVVDRSMANNPTLAAAVVEERRARLLEEAEEHRYGFVLELDGGVTRTVTPNAAFANSNLTFPESFSAGVGGTLRKHLIWGTDLSLRIEGLQQRSINTFTNVVTNPPTTTQLTVGPNWSALVRFDITQPLLRGAGRDVAEAALDQARASRSLSEISRSREASQLLVDALSAYWELDYASRAREIQERSLELARAQRDDSAKRVETGSLAPAELLSFETRVATIEEDVATASATERDKSAELARQLGDANATQRRADTTRAFPPSRSLPELPDARALALAASYEVKEKEAAVQLAEVQAKTAADSLRPRLDADAYVQAQGLGQRSVAPAFDQLGTMRAVSMHIGLTYELPLDSTQRRNERDRAELAISVAQNELQATKQRVATDLDVALRKAETARTRVDLAARSHAIAQKQLDAQSMLFRTGSATALAVREAEDQVRSAELREARANVDLVIAELQVTHLLGRLLADASR